MRLPSPLYEAVRDQMSHHGDWHLARIPKNQVEMSLRPKWKKAHKRYPHVKTTDQLGAGQEFLQAHRDMLRCFKWIVAHTTGHGYTYDPWHDLPAWLRSAPGWPAPDFIDKMLNALPALIAGNDADALGGFIEDTAPYEQPFSGMHDLIHGIISGYEAATFSGDPRLVDADMQYMEQAHHNEHFWALHGWIDEKYADWQRNNGQTVDQSAVDPMSGMMHMG